MKQGWSRALKVTLFLGRRLGGGRRQPLLASRLLLLNKDLQFFSSVNRSRLPAPQLARIQLRWPMLTRMPNCSHSAACTIQLDVWGVFPYVLSSHWSIDS